MVLRRVRCSHAARAVGVHALPSCSVCTSDKGDNTRRARRVTTSALAANALGHRRRRDATTDLPRQRSLDVNEVSLQLHELLECLRQRNRVHNDAAVREPKPGRDGDCNGRGGCSTRGHVCGETLGHCGRRASCEGDVTPRAVRVVGGDVIPAEAAPRARWWTDGSNAARLREATTAAGRQRYQHCG